MPGYVADASATLPWCFEEERARPLPPQNTKAATFRLPLSFILRN